MKVLLWNMCCFEELVVAWDCCLTSVKSGWDYACDGAPDYVRAGPHGVHMIRTLLDAGSVTGGSAQPAGAL